MIIVLCCSFVDSAWYSMFQLIVCCTFVEWSFREIDIEESHSCSIPFPFNGCSISRSVFSFWCIENIRVKLIVFDHFSHQVVLKKMWWKSQQYPDIIKICDSKESDSHAHVLSSVPTASWPQSCECSACQESGNKCFSDFSYVCTKSLCLSDNLLYQKFVLYRGFIIFVTFFDTIQKIC